MSPTQPSLAPDTPSGSPSQSPDESAAPGSQEPATPSPDGSEPAPNGGADVVASATAVMVTPEPPNASTYAYGPHARHRIDAYWRTAAGERARGQDQRARPTPGPAILVFHGGSWISGDKSSWKYFARRLTNQGYTVFAANYRLAGQAAWPAQRDDAVAALDFVKKHAAKWNVDPNNIVAFGSSAGGLLAGQLGTYGKGAQRVRGVLALSPVNNPYLAYQDGLKPGATLSQRNLTRAVVKLIGCVPTEADPVCRQQAEDANAAAHAGEGDAPVLLMHTEEELIPATHSTPLGDALRGADIPATVKVLPGDGHASALLNDPSTYPTLLNWLKARTSE